MKQFISFIVLSVVLFCNVNAQDRLYPMNTLRYEGYLPKMIDRILEDTPTNYFIVTVDELGHPNIALTYDSTTSSLILKEETTMNMKITEFRCTISKDAVFNYKRLFYSAIMSSSYFTSIQVKGYGCRSYNFCCMKMAAGCYISNDCDSNSQRLIAIVDDLIDAVKNNDTDKVESMTAQARELTQAFEALYPDGINADNYWLSLNDEIKSFIAMMYQEKLYEDYDFLQAHCSAALLKRLQDAYPYDADGVAYATWLFRSGYQDSNPDSRVGSYVRVTVDKDDWYILSAVDMGWEFTKRIKAANIDGKIVISDIYPIEE